ncbi:MAG: amidohydrolase family protein [Clostridia bacterium]|nr:amidohydrolase family protein [Clostridia bacterium]
MKYVYNAKVVLENGILWDGAILTRGDRIEQIGKADTLPCPARATPIDAKGKYVGPGFVDIHVHGGGDSLLFKDPLKCARYFLAHGTTTILASPHYKLTGAEYVEAYERVRRAMQDPNGKSIAGVYMEGPYVNPRFGSGAENNKWKDAIRKEDYEPVVDAAKDLVKVWVIAPEREGLLPFVEYAKKVNPNVHFAVGHSLANSDQIQRFKPYGLSILTHCMDATGRNSDWSGTRGCGPDEACFLDRDMYAELICDSAAAHVSPALCRLILQNKGLERVILITDGSAGNYVTPERFRHLTDLSINEAGELSGSRLTMAQACRNLMTHTNCGIAQAFLLASRNPACAIGMGHEVGTLAPGKKANLVFVDDTFRLHGVMLEGEMQTTE